MNSIKIRIVSVFVALFFILLPPLLQSPCCVDKYLQFTSHESRGHAINCCTTWNIIYSVIPHKQKVSFQFAPYNQMTRIKFGCLTSTSQVSQQLKNLFLKKYQPKAKFHRMTNEFLMGVLARLIAYLKCRWWCLLRTKPLQSKIGSLAGLILQTVISSKKNCVSHYSTFSPANTAFHRTGVQIDRWRDSLGKYRKSQSQRNGWG